MEQPLKVRASLRIVREDKLFGPGVAQLLEGVEELGSLRRSAARMEMSYNKAWSVVHGLRGGSSALRCWSGASAERGAAAQSLTEWEGRALVARYRAFSNRQAHEIARPDGRGIFFGSVGGRSELERYSVKRRPWVLVRGAGDLATGVIVRLHRCGFRVVSDRMRGPFRDPAASAALCEAVWRGTANGARA